MHGSGEPPEVSLSVADNGNVRVGGMTSTLSAQSVASPMGSTHSGSRLMGGTRGSRGDSDAGGTGQEPWGASRGSKGATNSLRPLEEEEGDEEDSLDDHDEKLLANQKARDDVEAIRRTLNL